MARYQDLYRSGRENLPAMKDESDSATVASGIGIVSLKTARSEKDRESQLQGNRGDVQTMTPLELTSELRISDHYHQEMRSPSLTARFLALEAKFDVLLKKSGSGDSTDQDCVEIQDELKKLMQSTMKQRDAFNQLYEMVQKQKLTIQAFENLMKNSKHGLPLPFGSSWNSRSVSAVQCSEDLEDLDEQKDQPVVYLIRGRHEFHRKMSQCSSDQDILNNIYIPDAFNSGNRMLPGRRDYPHMLLQSPMPDTLVNDRTALVLHQRPSSNEPRDLGAVAGLHDLALRDCPVCGMTFEEGGPMEAFLLHVDSHFNSDQIN